MHSEKITAKTFVSNSNDRYFIKGLDKGQTPALDETKIAEAEMKDGFFAIVTNLHDKSAVLDGKIAQSRLANSGFGSARTFMATLPCFSSIWVYKSLPSSSNAKM